MTKPPTLAAVLIHVPREAYAEAAAWYSRVFPDTIPIQLEADITALDFGGWQLELVYADKKVPTGAAGTVVYWGCDDFEARFTELLSLGATRFRGPLDIEGGQRMAQVKDPWGNALGLRGPVR